MICRRCLHRATALVARERPSAAAAAIRTRLPALTTTTTSRRPFSQTTSARSSSPAPAPGPSDPPQLTTPLAADSAAAAAAGGGGGAPKSSCPEGTAMVGLNYFKNKTDPVALADDAYPAWLWGCLDVQKRASEEGAEDDAGDEFSKSKKQRRLAMKRQRVLEARLLAEGNLEALAPKIPLPQQTVNLAANEEGTTEGAVAAAAAREELRRALRRERKAKIKESNYLKSM